MANADTPPSWSPEMADDPTHPYTLSEYRKDVGRWLRATKVAPERCGPLLALAIGGLARVYIDDIEDDTLAFGMDVDLKNGQGFKHYTGIQLIFHVLQRKFPENTEARMLRTGMEFFSFPPLL